MSYPLRLPIPLRALFVCVLALPAIWSLPAGPALAQSAAVGPSSGLPLPRYVSVRNAPTNVRVGPGTQYDIAFTFIQPGVPVEIVQEFDTWRKIRDVEGDEGWVHQNLVVGDRTALVAPWQTGGGPIALRAGLGPNTAVRAWLGPKMLVSVRSCDGTSCEIRLTHTRPGSGSATYQGFVPQTTLWGVYEGEIFD